MWGWWLGRRGSRGKGRRGAGEADGEPGFYLSTRNPAIIPTMTFEFTLEAQDGAARLGRFQTPHGAIETPVLAQVGT